MIAANELRIGNCVYFSHTWKKQIHSRPCKVLILDKDFAILDDIDGIMSVYYETDSIQPIPLTPDILIACGFEEIFDWTVSDKRKHDCTHFLDLGYLYIARNMLGGITLFQHDNKSTGTHVEYLHQLQNLFFSLTGKELIYDFNKMERS